MALPAFSYTVLLFFIACIISSTSVGAVTVSIPDQEAREGTVLSIPVILDEAQQGLAGYVMDISLSDSEVARIVNVTFPNWAGLHNAEIQSDSSVSLKAVDIYQSVEDGSEDITLATLIVKGETPGTLTIQPHITTLDDDDGYAITASVIPATMQVTTGGGEIWQLHLYPGWNMISIPVLLQPGEDTAAAFSGIPVDGHSIFTFSPSQGWQTLDQNSVIRPTDAYWIYTEQEIFIPFSVGATSISDKQLVAGWNLIGIPGSVPVYAETVLIGAPEWVYLIRYEAETQRYQEPIINSVESKDSGILLVPGTGYWIFMRENGILSGN